jgi:hypothetical protein
VRGHRDLSGVCLAALACGAITVAVPVELIRVLFAIPLVFLLPGYAIIAASFGPRQLSPVQLGVFSLGTSLATLALSGLLLNVLPGGLETITWALLLVAIVLAGCRVAAVRRSGPQPRGPRRTLTRPGAGATAMLAGAAILAIAAFVLAQTPLSATHAVGYTALWMLPGADARTVEVGVDSNEQHHESYKLVVGAEAVGRSREFDVELEPGEEATFRVPVLPSGARPPTEVIATLYRRAAPGSPYRRVTSWLSSERTFAR